MTDASGRRDEAWVRAVSTAEVRSICVDVFDVERHSVALRAVEKQQRKC